MKYAIGLMLSLFAAGALAQECPPNSNNPQCRASTYSVTITMKDERTGKVQSQHTEQDKNYQVAGSMYIYAVEGLKTWYEDVIAAAEAGGVSLRMVDPENPLGVFVDQTPVRTKVP